MTRKETNQLGFITGIQSAALNLIAGTLAARLWPPLLWVGIAGAAFFTTIALLWLTYDPDKPHP